MNQLQPIIDCQGVGKTSRAGQQMVTILRDVNFSIFDGEYVMLCGPSGSGKTSLLNLIAGFEQPTSGRIKIKNRILGHYNPRDLASIHRTKIGMVFQQFNLIPTLTVLDNVSLPQVFLGVDLHTRRRRAYHLLQMFQVESKAEQRPTELSGGEQQRVAIARALINNPWLLLIDEPTGNLDSTNAQHVMQILNQLNLQEKRTILLVTHNPEHLRFADRILYIKDGSIVDS